MRFNVRALSPEGCGLMERSWSLVPMALSAALLLAYAPAQAVQIIETVAGGGPNNVPAVSANLEDPVAVAVDASGNIFIAAVAAARVYKVDTSGLLTVVAGTGVPAFSGDGGPATRSSLRGPVGVALDAAGNLFIVDKGNNRIRRVDATTGIISTVAGDSTGGISGDGGPAISASLGPAGAIALDAVGNLFITISNVHYARIRRVDAGTGIITTVAGNEFRGFSGDDGPATNASLDAPTGLALDAAGNLFIADKRNHRIRRVDVTTGIITTVAGNGVGGFSGDGGPATSAKLSGPNDVVFDDAGNLFIVDNRRIRLVDEDTGIITTVAGDGSFGFSGDGGPATSASLNDSVGVALDALGNLFIADRHNWRIRRVDATTEIISTVAGNGWIGFSGDGGPATRASLKAPFGIAIGGAGNLFIADASNHRIRRVDARTGIISTVVGNGARGFSGDGGPATSANLFGPADVTLDTAGNMFIAEFNNHRIRRVDVTTGIISTVAGNGFRGISGDGDGGPATSASLLAPEAVALDAAGNIFIAEYTSNRIRRVDATTGVISTVAGNGVQGFSGDGGPATSATLWWPCDVAVDAVGNLFIAEFRGMRIRRVDAATGIITTVAGDGSFGSSGDGGPATSAQLGSPRSVAVDAAGNLFIAGLGSNRIRRVDAETGLISTVAGTGRFGFSGDGGLATSAQLAKPYRVEVDPAGTSLFISDFHSDRIRRVSLKTAPPAADLIFAPPLIAGALSAFKEIKVGRTIPVKFRLAGGTTSAATVAATISVFRAMDIATGSLDTTDLVADAGNANGDGNLFRFDRIGQQYIFNLSTRGFLAPATYRIFVTLDDGSRDFVDFSLRE